MNIAKGVIVDLQEHSAESNYHYKVKVRVLTIHGPRHISDYPPEISQMDRLRMWTPDDDLPWASVILPLDHTADEITSLLHEGELVYVLFPEEGHLENPLVIGTTGLDLID